ncbi:MAG: peptide chain release factor N(5)-glutamine methyltransferase [Thermoanaerobaculia bacterium]|nr:peptide chain release factor N(5)-glutamine methyltransferase [Thermoanaerobaculia bacterium]
MKQRLDEVRDRHRDDALGRGFNPRDVDLLLSDILGRKLSWIVAHGDELIDSAPLDVLLARRYGGEPLQYIRGRTEFYSREFLVDSRALIPRPETEILVETALQFAPRNGLVIDIGTGSGCIAITIERERPDLRVIGVDVSMAALALAATNRASLASHALLAASDILTSIRAHADLIVSNPPYIPAREVESLEVEVREHEPRIALTPGSRGTEAIEQILEQARGARVIVEMGFGQEQAVRDVAAAQRYVVDEIIPDLAGIPRVVILSPHA